MGYALNDEVLVLVVNSGVVVYASDSGLLMTNMFCVCVCVSLCVCGYCVVLVCLYISGGYIYGRK